ncbi:efflux RND transporter periplasmic adaptor subunit [Thiomonas sp. FB-6]|jgi:RND family efflux transporter MFP subunit|uniref:efflux RND transporter periplasmic adaptor subunit n=1 Tax=Thiomonas sp. FB-6 TaxID=1158291 RepID=UPI000363F3C3|nr:efflux RND transporter periplasmic adaptor subunit [Thiomonas sp. FB-6]
MSLHTFATATAPRLRDLPPGNTRWALILAAALAAATIAPALADVAPSALVRMAALQRGVLTRSVEAVGTVRTASGGTLSVDFARPVRVRRVLVRPGQGVRRDQVLLEVDNTPAGKARYAQAREALRFAKADLGRLLQLQSQQLATQSQVDAARKSLADARATLAAQQAQGMDQAREIVRAPFDGLVQSVQATPGMQLAAGGTALSLAPGAGLQAVVGVDPRQASELAPGTVAQLASVFDPAQSVQATVLDVAGRVDPASGRVEVRLALGATLRWLLPGLAVQASLPLHAWSGWLVPRQAVLRDADGQAYVFQDDHGHARRVAVRVEGDEGERSAISGALQPALPLVVLGNYELKDGMALRAGADTAQGQAR